MEFCFFKSGFELPPANSHLSFQICGEAAPSLCTVHCQLLNIWRRHPDLNRGSGCCRPLPYHLAIAPLFAFVNTQLLFTKTKMSAPASARAGTAYSEYRKNIPVNCWSGLRGSNSLPPPWQGGALPDELNPQLSVYSV